MLNKSSTSAHHPHIILQRPSPRDDSSVCAFFFVSTTTHNTYRHHRSLLHCIIRRYLMSSCPLQARTITVRLVIAFEQSLQKKPCQRLISIVRSELRQASLKLNQLKQGAVLLFGVCKVLMNTLRSRLSASG